MSISNPMKIISNSNSHELKEVHLTVHGNLMALFVSESPPLFHISDPFLTSLSLSLWIYISFGSAIETVNEF